MLLWFCFAGTEYLFVKDKVMMACSIYLRLWGFSAASLPQKMLLPVQKPRMQLSYEILTQHFLWWHSLWIYLVIKGVYESVYVCKALTLPQQSPWRNSGILHHTRQQFGSSAASIYRWKMCNSLTLMWEFFIPIYIGGPAWPHKTTA